MLRRLFLRVNKIHARISENSSRTPCQTYDLVGYGSVDYGYVTVERSVTDQQPEEHDDRFPPDDPARAEAGDRA